MIESEVNGLIKRTFIFVSTFNKVNLFDLCSVHECTLRITFLVVGCRQQKHPFERVATPYQVHSWMAPSLDHNVDYIRAEDGQLPWSSFSIEWHVFYYSPSLLCDTFCWSVCPSHFMKVAEQSISLCYTNAAVLFLWYFYLLYLTFGAYVTHRRHPTLRPPGVPIAHPIKPKGGVQ